MYLERVVQAALRTPWALHQDYLAIVQDVLISRTRGHRLTDEQIRDRIEAMRASMPQRVSLFDDDDDEEEPDKTQYATIPLAAAAGGGRAADGVVAVIPMWGVICNRSFDASSGMTSTDFLSAMFTRAEGDPNVKAILFDIASPGGSVDGIAELGKLMKAGEKPRVGFVNALSASAAYWLGSQCHELVARESASVGSVGVYALLEDWSEYLKNEGIKINAISAGDYKLEGAPWEPLSDEGRAFIQEQVDTTYQKFLAAVASGRGTSVSDVKKNYGQGRCLSAQSALAAGMVDKIGELDVALSRCNALARSLRTSAAARPASVSASSEPTLKPERYMGDPQGQENAAGVEPDSNGNCPDGYEKGEDGLCYVQQNAGANDDATAALALQAQADRDAIELAKA